MTASRDLRELPVGVGGADSDEDLGVPEGRYRLVVLARAHEAGRGGEFAKETADSYCLLLRPADEKPDRSCGSGGAEADYWH